jgi:hypothetical protein
MSRPAAKVVLAGRVDQDLVDRADKLAEATGLTRSEVVERALMVGLEDQEKFVGQLQGAVRGPLLALLLNEKFLDVIFAMTGDVKDETQLRAIKKIRGDARVSSGGTAKKLAH